MANQKNQPTFFSLVASFLIFALFLVIFFQCTLPGFLHISGFKKDESLNNVCMLFGVMFGISLFLGLVSSVYAIQEAY